MPYEELLNNNGYAMNTMNFVNCSIRNLDEAGGQLEDEKSVICLGYSKGCECDNCKKREIFESN